jgi:hypothetical protein
MKAKERTVYSGFKVVSYLTRRDLLHQVVQLILPFILPAPLGDDLLYLPF